ncbi:SUKH-3 domain containing protein [Streptomyces sp. SCUT-3]|uniref:SUKH-3 domain-containing protein n=1 Tax=Streptomyces TaxID=1883 RepID=UPI0015FD8342|nr:MULTISPECIES: SUKH-3 domain-containing protein [unclassified Streptomyces]MCZ2525653.1 SUKH-3 domain-containing protein [Streptomyces sp. HB2AG]QMV23098.1 SUKH-3 domain containing protein [Streptomyces sp. SCUT-3]
MNAAPPSARTDTTRFPVSVDVALREAGWLPGRWDIRQAEVWADTLRAHVSPGGHRHAVFPAAVEAWAEFGGLDIGSEGPGKEVARTPFTVDPMRGLHSARTLSDLGRALGTQVAPLGEEEGGRGLLAVDAHGRVHVLDHAGDWYLGPTLDRALCTLLTGLRPTRLTPG